jgi:hypothetical protein
MKIVLLIALIIVIAHAEELKPNQVQVGKAKELVDVLTFDTEAIVNDVIRDKRQFGEDEGG